MTDQGANISAAGCLGRMLSALGVVWLIIVALAGLGVLSESGWSGSFFAGIGSSLIPGLLFLAAGRAVSRRARTMAEAEPLPQPSGAPTAPARGRTTPTKPAQKVPIPFEPPPPTPSPRPAPPPRPAVDKALESVSESRSDSARQPGEISAQPGTTTDKPRPKTSQELVDEARRRWGMDKP